jgi:hypothetical protein
MPWIDGLLESGGIVGCGLVLRPDDLDVGSWVVRSDTRHGEH